MDDHLHTLSGTRYAIVEMHAFLEQPEIYTQRHGLRGCYTRRVERITQSDERVGVRTFLQQVVQRLSRMTEQEIIPQYSHDYAELDEARQLASQPSRILVADDDPGMRQLLGLVLGSSGFDVLTAADGYELLRIAQGCRPNLIVVDLGMPRMDGFEAIRRLRGDSRTAHIPTIILTARSSIKDVVSGFESGADDYIAKPFDPNELLARVQSHLRRSAQRPVHNPLTGLPGGVLLSQELRHRLSQNMPLALLYADLDNFKIFNDTYGFSHGDRAILLLAQAIQTSVMRYGGIEEFTGHIGGDDFAVLSVPQRASRMSQAIIDSFDEQVGQLYNREDRLRGYISGADRYGILRRFGLMTLSIGVATNQRRAFSDEVAFTQVAAEMKHFAKGRPGSCYAIDQRGPYRLQHAERRRQHSHKLVIVSADRTLRSVLHTAFEDHEYTIEEALTIIDALDHLSDPLQPTVILADAELGPSLWAFCARQARDNTGPAVVVLTYHTDDLAQARAAGAAASLQLPLPFSDIIACVDRLI